MAATRKLVLSNCLCYIVNKFGKTANKSLKSIIQEFYTSEHVTLAKDTLFEAVDTLNIENFPKSIRRRRQDSQCKLSVEFDDILAILAYLDEQRYLDKLPIFVADSPDNMPSSKLIEGDLSLLWNKLDKLDISLNQVSDNYASSLHDIRKMADVFGINHIGLKSKHTGNTHATLIGNSMNDPTVAASSMQADNVIVNIQPIGSEFTSRGRWGSITSNLTFDSEPEITDIDDRDFTVVQRNKNKPTKRSANVAGISPNENISKTKRNDDVPSQATLAAIVGRTIPGSTSNQVSKNHPVTVPLSAATNKATGNMKYLIKAATPIPNAVEKITFGIYNVSRDYGVNDILSQCKQLNIKVLFCFDVTKQTQTSKSFKLAVDKKDQAKMLGKGSFPPRVGVRLWNYKQSADAHTQEEGRPTLSISDQTLSQYIDTSIYTTTELQGQGPRLQQNDSMDSLLRDVTNASNPLDSNIHIVSADMHNSEQLIEQTFDSNLATVSNFIINQTATSNSNAAANSCSSDIISMGTPTEDIAAANMNENGPV